MCFGCSKEPSHRNGETVLLSTQDKCLLGNQVICQLRILIWRSDNVLFFRVLSPRKYCNEYSSEPFVVVLRSSLFRILKCFCKAIRRRICISPCYVVVEDLLVRFMYIRSSDVMRSYLVGLDTFLLLPPLHTRQPLSGDVHRRF